jgi:L-alanine-DL-glutamate epimerase-like enolase superfamily enzyme
MANFLILEYHMAHIPWWQDLVEHETDLVQGGHMVVPARPGLGVDLNADVVRQHMREGNLLLDR